MRTPDTHPPDRDSRYKAVVMGGSAGSTVIIEEILGGLSPDFPVPIFIVKHLHESDEGCCAEHLSRCCGLRVVVPCDKQPIQNGCVYVAPANYHMLLERNRSVSLSIDRKVNWSRPSIDVLFESAAYACGNNLIAVILSGANEDGAVGMKIVKDYGGIAIVQSPESAESPVMPQAAIKAARPDYIQRPADIVKLLTRLAIARSGGRSSDD